MLSLLGFYGCVNTSPAAQLWNPAYRSGTTAFAGCRTWARPLLLRSDEARRQVLGGYQELGKSILQTSGTLLGRDQFAP